MIRRPPRSTLSASSAASDVYKRQILIASGGTGGHIFPAIALAKEFRLDGHKVVIAGTGNELEKKIFSEHDVEIKYFKSRLKGLSLIHISEPTDS